MIATGGGVVGSLGGLARCACLRADAHLPARAGGLVRESRAARREERRALLVAAHFCEPVYGPFFCGQPRLSLYTPVARGPDGRVSLAILSLLHPCLSFVLAETKGDVARRTGWGRE